MCLLPQSLFCLFAYIGKAESKSSGKMKCPREALGLMPVVLPEEFVALALITPSNLQVYLRLGSTCFPVSHSDVINPGEATQQGKGLSSFV